MRHSRVSPTYRLVMAVATPMVRWWGRLKVEGVEVLATSDPILIVTNHDSHWDPVVVGVAARGVQVRALAKASLWKNPVLGRVLDGMGQIPIERGRSDTAALSTAIDCLAAGACIGVFPEGTISKGREMRALSGAGRLALAVPEARVVAVATTGVVDLARFPRRPRLRVRFFLPEDGPAKEGESAIKLTRRLMNEVRTIAPPTPAGRHPSAVDAEA